MSVCGSGRGRCLTSARGGHGAWEPPVSGSLAGGAGWEVRTNQRRAPQLSACGADE